SSPLYRAYPSGNFPTRARLAPKRHKPYPGERDMKGFGAALIAACTLVSINAISVIAMAADYPAPKQGDWVAKDFKFHTGETMPELKLHYTTVGAPTGQPVLVLHGSGG